jgi:hypothetical protein
VVLWRAGLRIQEALASLNPISITDAAPLIAQSDSAASTDSHLPGSRR